MAQIKVTRGYKHDAILCVGSDAFQIRDLVKAVRADLRAAGSTNIGFDQPPFFRTGSPYGAQILEVARRHGISRFDPPADMDFATLPHDGMYTPMKDKAIWPEVFGCDFSLEYPNGKYTPTPQATPAQIGDE